jgi:hypothetical protein
VCLCIYDTFVFTHLKYLIDISLRLQFRAVTILGSKVLNTEPSEQKVSTLRGVFCFSVYSLLELHSV